MTPGGSAGGSAGPEAGPRHGPRTPWGSPPPARALRAAPQGKAARPPRSRNPARLPPGRPQHSPLAAAAALPGRGWHRACAAAIGAARAGLGATASLNSLGGKGSACIIRFLLPALPRTAPKSHRVPESVDKCFLNSARLGAVTTSLGVCSSLVLAQPPSG